MSKTIKKLEIILIILYFIACIAVYVVAISLLIGVIVGGLVAIVDWFLLKKMSKRWVKMSKFSYISNTLRYLLVALLIIGSYKILKFSFIGLIVGFSIMPLALLVYFVLYKKELA